MKRFVVVTCACLLALPAASEASSMRSTEGCQALNPGQPKCNYTVTHETESPVTGVAAVGDWVVTIKRGKKKNKEKEKIKSPASGEPTAVEYAFQEGDKVTAVALSPGSGVIVGHAD